MSTNSFIYLSIYFWGPKGPQIQFCICKQFHSFLNLFLRTTGTTDSILYLQTVSFFSQFIFGDQKDHRFCILSTNSFIFLSIYFWGPKGPKIQFCICKQFHSFLNLFLKTTGTTDCILYLQTLSLFSANSFIFLSIYFRGPKGPQILYSIYKQFHFSLNLFLGTKRTTDSILYLQTVSFFSQFIFEDHGDHRLYFVSINSFTFLSIYF